MEKAKASPIFAAAYEAVFERRRALEAEDVMAVITRDTNRVDGALRRLRTTRDEECVRIVALHDDPTERIRHARHGAEPFLASALQMLGGGAALLVSAWLHGEFPRLNLAAITPRAWFAFTYLVTVGSLVGFSTFVWLMKHSTPARVATYAYVNPIVAIFLGWLLLGEPVTSRTLVASAVIIAAVVIITVQKSRPAAA